MLARAYVVPFLLLMTLVALPLAGCGDGGTSGSEPAQAQSPSSPPSPRLVTLIGSRQSKGLHWIIVGDGFTAGEQEDLRSSAMALARELIDTPELAAHTSVWNVHLLEAISAQSGVDDSAANRFVDTAFDGSLGCGSNARIACVDWARINGALQSQQAPQAQVAVILNTPVYLGSSNSSGIVVSRHADSRLVALHEMGHRVAGLADEYVDDVVAGEWLPLYVEGRFPNVTRVRDAGQAPWRHWLDDSAKGVGLFEGAFYCAAGFYRAKQDSLMRTLQAPLGEVNAEAWLRAQYRALPPLSAVSPAGPQVQALSGETVQFSVVSEWPAGAVELRWQVDGLEVPGTVDAPSFKLLADGLPHEVQVSARDVSGRIRASEAVEATARHLWRVSADAPAAETTGQKMSPVTAPTAWLEVRVDSSGHRLLARLEAPPVAAGAVDRPAGSHWQYSLLDDQDQVLARGDILDPRIAWTALSAPGQPHAGHAPALLDSGVYYVGIPQGASPRKLRIAATAAGMEKLGGSARLSAETIELPPESP
jgi:hypothetical protein